MEKLLDSHKRSANVLRLSKRFDLCQPQTAGDGGVGGQSGSLLRPINETIEHLIGMRMAANKEPAAVRWASTKGNSPAESNLPIVP